MDHQKPEQQASEYKVVSGIRVVEETVEIQKPIFRDVDVERPNYVDKEVEIPKLDLEKVAQSIADIAMSHILSKLEAKLDQAIKGRLDTIESPKIVEKVTVVDRDVVVERPVFRDVEVTNAVVKDVQVNNAVVKDVPVTNAVIKDMEVTNAILQDKVVINPVFKDIEIDRPFYKDKEIICIHPKYIDLQGRDVK